MTEAAALDVDWLLARPGVRPAVASARLRLDGGRIAAIEPAQRAGMGLLALPALANAHDHGRALRPVAYGAADQPLETWVPALMRGPKADLYTQCVVAFGRLALSGVASILHMHIPQGDDPVAEAQAAARAARDVGVRLAYAVPVVDANPFVYGDADALCGHHDPSDWAIVRHWDGRPAPASAQLDAVAAIASACEAPHFTVQYGPAGPQWVTEEGWRDLADRAGADGRRVHTHLLETKVQRQWSDAHHPDGLVQWLDGMGLLNDRLTVAHGVWLNPTERALLAERGVTVAINTSSNLRLRSGSAPVRAFHDAGLTVALGLDGMAFDDDEDMLRELRLFHALNAPIGLDGVGLTTADVWLAATANGRRVIDGATTDGCLDIGADADILVLDYAALAVDAVDGAVDPVELIMTRARRAHVRSLYVAGRCIVDDGRLTGVDLDMAEAELAKCASMAAPDLRGERDLLTRHLRSIRAYYRQGGHLGQSGNKGRK